MAHSKTRTIRTTLFCKTCGQAFTIHRLSSRKKPRGHIKHLYCIKCKKRTKHIENIENIEDIKNRIGVQQ